MATNINKTKPFITPDWTQMDGRSKPFYQPASAGNNALPERYSVAVLSEHSTTGGELQTRMNAAIPSGLSRILRYYSKKADNSITNSATAEDFYISERPNAKMKVLVSFPCSDLESLPDKQLTQPQHRPPAHEIKFSFFNIRDKLEIANKFIIKYGEEIEKFHGKVYGFNYNKESKKLSGFVPALVQLLQENNIVATDASSDLITLLATEKYEVIYGRINRGSGPLVLSKGFDNFIDNPSIKHKRVIKILSKLDEIQNVVNKGEDIPWAKFFEDYMYNPPKYDFSTQRPASAIKSEKVDKTIEKDKNNPVKTREQRTLFQGFQKLEENSKELLDWSEEASVFIGDSIVGNLDQLGDNIGEISALFGDVLNATGLDDILKSALDCLNIDVEFNLGTVNDDLLDSVNQLFLQAERTLPHNIPTMSFPDSFPIVDLLKDIGMNILKTVIGALIGALITMIQELIKLMFSFCSECSIRTEDGYVKKANRLNFGGGGASFGQFVGAGMSLGGRNLFVGGVVGAFADSRWTGNMDSFSQSVLKNSVNNIDKFYDHETRRIQVILETGNSTPENENTPKSLTNTRHIENLLAEQFGSTPAELRKSGFLKGQTFKEINEIVRRRAPWSAETFQEASKQLSQYFDTVMSSWTPSEIGNSMLGCPIPPEAKEVARNALPNYPDLNFALRGEDDNETDDNLADIWDAAGKMLGHDSVLKTIAQLAENIPKEFKCLDELDDTALREELLSNKDPNMDANAIAEQVAKAKKRTRDKIQEMSDLMGRDDIFEGKTPPLFCSLGADGKTVIPGILPTTHPTQVFAIKRCLDTTYDSLKMSFNDDVRSWVPSLTIKTTTKVEVPRTLTVEGPGIPSDTRIINPDFKRMIRDGLVTYGSHPEGATVPKSNTPADVLGPDHDPEDAEGTEIKYNRFLQLFSTDWANPEGAGMWDEGQTEPTPEQENEWERRNLRWEIRKDVQGNPIGTKRSGGRTWDIENAPQRAGEFIYGTDWQGAPVRIVDYTRKFGYSPIPVFESKEGPPSFVPGLKKSFQDMCINDNLFSIKLGDNNGWSNSYSFSVPNNVVKESGIDLDTITQNLNKYGGSAMRGLKDQDIVKQLTDSFDIISKAEFKIEYVVPVEQDAVWIPGQPSPPPITIPKDEYRLNFSIGLPGTPAAARTAFQELNLTSPADRIEVKTGAKKVIEDKNLRIVRDHRTNNAPVQPQIGYFYDYSSNAWKFGGSLYRNNVKIQGDSSPGLSLVGMNFYPKFKEFLYDEDTYKNIFKDLFCSFTNQIAQSPYLNLRDESGKGMLDINLAPAKILGLGKECQPTLLDVDIIKEQVVREHDLLKCINRFWRSEDDIASNKDSPYQVASRAGCVLLTVRVYVVEYILKFAYAFHYFTPSTPDDVDQTSVFYVFNKIEQEIEARGQGTVYFKEFQRETINLYNRNKPESEQLSHASVGGNKYVNFRKALDALIRYQIFSVSRRLSRDFVDLKGGADGGDPHSILLQEWLPTVEPPRHDGEERFTNLGNFNTVAQVGTINEDILAAMNPGGTLSEEGIRRMSGENGPPYNDGWDRIPHLRPVGKLFREYFTPDVNLEKYKDYPPNLAYNAAESLWPNHAAGEARHHENGPDKNTKGQQSWPLRPVMGGIARESAILNIPARAGKKGWGPSDQHKEPYGHPEAIGKTPDGQRGGTGGYYRLGISDAEQKAMGKITQFLYAAQFWTIGRQNPAAWSNLGGPPPRPIKPAHRGYQVHYDWSGMASWAKTWYNEANNFVLQGDARSSGQIGGHNEGSMGYAGQPFWAREGIRAKASTTFTGRQVYRRSSIILEPEVLREFTRWYGPGSLLKWATTRKSIIPSYATLPGAPNVSTFSGMVDAAADWLGLGADPTLQTFTGYGFNWAYGENQPDLPDIEPSRGCINLLGDKARTVADPGVAGAGSTSPGRRHTFMNIYTDKSSWTPEPAWALREALNPREAAATTDEIGVLGGRGSSEVDPGMPDLPPDYLSKLGISAAQPRNRLLVGPIVATPVRSNNLRYFLLPESNWGQGSRWALNVDEAIANNKAGRTQYISLLDLHPDAVRRALIWEQGMYQWFLDNLLDSAQSPYKKYVPFRVGHEQNARNAEIKFYKYMIQKYENDWIPAWEEVMDNLKLGEEQRRCQASKVQLIENSGRMPRNELKASPMLDVSNGNLVLEPYIRVVDYTDTEAEERDIKTNVRWVKGNIPGTFFNNIPYLLRDDFTKGVVNIDHWDDFMKNSFTGVYPKDKWVVAVREMAPAGSPPPTEECGDNLPTRDEKLVGVTTPPGVLSIPQLQDYFHSVYYGLRIMYLPKPGQQYPVRERRRGASVFSRNRRTSDRAQAIAKREKAFYLWEQRPSSEFRRDVHPYPLVSIETPISMATTITTATTSIKDPSKNIGGLAAECGEDPPPPNPPQPDINYFRWLFKQAPPDGLCPRDQLQQDLIKTDDYTFLFKYCFPIDRMLSLGNIYSATYMAALPDNQRVFEPTKEELMGIFMRSLRAGDWQNACAAGNADMLDALMNGISLPWAAILQMVLKWPLLVFKGFMEQADINIAISQNIRNVIKSMNATIAAIQTQANAVQQAGAGAISAIEQIANISVAKENCGIGIHTPAPAEPPDDLFDPVEQNLLYVPETWMIGLALLPSSIFAPWLWGPPINIPWGLAYWALDDSNINWMNAFPDFPNDLWARKDKLRKEKDIVCPPDFDINDIFNGSGNKK